MIKRLPIAMLMLSAVGFAGIAVNEHFTAEAVVPVKGDRPTVGLGSTFRDDGTPVRLGDTITPTAAIVRSISHIKRDEIGLRRCVTAPLSQAEYDILVDFAYQYGVPAACKSSMVSFSNAGRYVDACNAYTRYRFAGGFDCSTPGNRVCAGVWQRSLGRRAKCLAAQ